jgi:hypothetical protein
MRSAVVWLYIGLAFAALIPGLLIKIAPLTGGRLVLPPQLLALGERFNDIRFGSGYRFWLGVTGASLMALLLLYPLRKTLSRTRFLGSVGGWFHLHIVIGLIGPVLILYHCNFGHGGSNANVALWSMLVIAASGVIGFFVYARVSRDFYATKQQAQQYRDGLLAALPHDHNNPTWKLELAATFEAFEAGLLTPRQGLVSCIIARYKVETSRRQFGQSIVTYLADCTSRHLIGPDDIARIRATVSGHLRGYFTLAATAASQSVREQIWARWRLFHLPLFLLMVFATVLHIAAVWDMEPPETETAVLDADGSRSARSIDDLLNDKDQEPVLLGQPKIVTARPKQNDGVRQKRVASIDISGKNGPKGEPNAPAAAPLVTPPAPAPQPANPPVSGQPAAILPPVAIAPPAPLMLPPATLPPAPPATAAPPPDIYRELQQKVEAMPDPAPVLSAPRPTISVPVQTPTSTPAAVADPPAQPVVRTASRSLAEQFADFKQRRDSNAFAHNDSETGFALTGKHVKLDCAACHKQPLRETRQPAPRQCVSCHKKDDIHRGRQPACAQCHTTNRWAQIVRRR